ncbi:MAG: GDSL-type esterase/lipase family protein [Prevotellaceae bacterium]|jgi:lysophospholipase L1-like esterase|nr:GDSL-type esterase/lipase family protein [Prevotellaceae bacterium]
MFLELRLLLPVISLCKSGLVFFAFIFFAGSGCTLAAFPSDSAACIYPFSDAETFVLQSSHVDTIAYELSLKHSFAGAENNLISDSTKKLYPFFEKLRNLRRAGSAGSSAQTVSIVHIGDSHVQADFKPGTVRKLMQLYFGNAGRGLIAPLKIAKTNGAGNYRISSDSKWDVARLVKSGGIPIGLTGLALRVADTIAQLNVSTIDESFYGEWAFNRINAIYELSKSSASIADSLIISRDTLGPYGESFLLKHPVSNIDVSFSSSSESGQISFFGFDLSNGKNGVIYHSIGINGAQYSDFKREELLCRQLAYLKPDLIIVSLGTNEAYAKTLNRNFSNDVFDLVFSMMEYSPEAAVLLATPPETYKRYARNKRAPNHLAGEVRQAIENYALTYGCPYWDMYKATGGKGSALQWNKKKLLVKDGVHFTKEGYEFQGELLFQALIRAYNQYIKDR